MKKRLLVFLLIIVILLSILPASTLYRLNKEKKTIRTEMENLPTQTYTEEQIDADLADAESDIEGMTMLDKKNAGLAVGDGSDTDGDGLTDKQEIEEYGTDPLKASTSGDLYSDGVKVMAGMDLTKTYDAPEEIAFVENECPEVSLTAKEATDISASVVDMTDSYDRGALTVNLPKKYSLIRAYAVDSYTGDLTIDVTDITALGIDADDIKVFKYTDDEYNAEESDYTTEGNVITVPSTEGQTCYDVFLVMKSTTTNAGFNLPGISNVILTVQGKEKTLDDVDVKALFLAPIFQGSLGTHGKMYMVSTGDDELDTQLKEQLAAWEERYEWADFDNADTVNMSKSWIFGKSIWEDREPFTADDVKVISSFQYAYKLALCHQMLPEDCENVICPDEYESLRSEIFRYATYDNMKETFGDGDTTSEESTGTYSTGFSYFDELPFANFKPSTTKDGICSGIAYLTALLYNQGYAAPSGSEIIWTRAKLVNYDISIDPANATLTDRGLSDYKDKLFTLNHTDSKGILSTDLTDGEKQFTNMVTCLWNKYNRANPAAKSITTADNPYNWHMVESACAYLDTGKILCCDINYTPVHNEENDYHTVNIVGYHKNSDDEVVFDVYDNNYPCNTYYYGDGTQKLNFVNMTLTCTREEINNVDSFSYEFIPTILLSDGSVTGVAVGDKDNVVWTGNYKHGKPYLLTFVTDDLQLLK